MTTTISLIEGKFIIQSDLVMHCNGPSAIILCCNPVDAVSVQC